MTRDDVMSWVARYEAAWRSGDPDAVDALFSDDAQYRRSPYEASIVGHAAIKAFWFDGERDTFTMDASVIAVEGRDAVVRAEVRYGDPVHNEYRDLWVVRFDDNGRVADFEEWAYWPGKSFVADDETFSTEDDTFST